MAEAEKDDWLDDLDTPGEQASEFDQSDIDALLAGTSTPGSTTPSPSPGEGEEQDLGQSDIDALLAGVGEGGGGLDSGDLDQSDIDALLASPKSEARGQEVSDPDQDEIDKLFSDVESNGGGGESAENTPFPAEEIDFKDIFDSTDSATQTGLPDFDAEEFKLDADIPDIPDTTGFDLEATDIFQEAAVPSPPPQPTSEPGPPGPETMAPAAAAPGPPSRRWHLPGTPKVWWGVAAGVSALLIGAGLFLFKGAPKSPPEESAPTVVAQPPAPTGEEEGHAPPPPPAAAPPPPPVAQDGNLAPTVNDLDLSIPPGESQLTITLQGLDPEGEPLEYEFQSMPEHGQLSGHAPHLIYIPTPGYSGPDGFTVRATDGKKHSAPALVKITRQPPLPSTQEIPPPLPATSALTPVAAKPAEGKAKPEACVVKPAKGKTAKKSRQNRPPVLAVQPLAPEYSTGDTVIMNASRTKDDKRDTLSFRWEQIAGVPVVLKPLNSEGSQVSFVAPATFNTVSQPALIFQVTATDREGARDSQELRITTKSRRNSALWRGHHE